MDKPPEPSPKNGHANACKPTELPPEIRDLVNKHLFRWLSAIFLTVATIFSLVGALVFDAIEDRALAGVNVRVDNEITRMEDTVDEYRDNYVHQVAEVSRLSWNLERAQENLSQFEVELKEGEQALENAKTLTENLESLAATVADLPNFREAVTATLEGVPASAVVSFDLKRCPRGWEEYRPAYGVFIRGIDRGAQTRDPEGERVPGAYQEDTLGRHRHEYEGKRARRGVTVDRGEDIEEIWQGGDRRQTDERNTRRFGEAETRPKNVALLYCVRSEGV